VSYLIEGVPDDELRRDLAAIRDELHCTAVMVTGAEVEHLDRAAHAVVDAGLDVWIRPHLPDRPVAEVLAQLADVASAAERLRAGHPDRVTLLVGSEFSHTAPGIVPGGWSYLRLRIILRARRLLRARITRRLDELLTRAHGVAAGTFHGPIGYSAAGWEEVDWRRFDLVGVSLYRSGTDHGDYARRVTDLVGSHDKPVVVTEFGCGAYAGADRRGAGSFRIVNWFADPPVVRDGHPRDESVQAHYLADLIDLYAAAGVAGCFAFTFAMRAFPRSDDPRQDLDRAGFGLVAVAEDGAPWVAKEAFHAVAQRYRALCTAPADRPER
jgi:hypothetical protein